MAVTLYLLGTAGAAVVIWWLVSHLQDPLRSIPGPYVARFTKLWVFWRFYLGSWHREVIELHRKYGPIVRIAPGHYSISDAEGIRPIHGHGVGFNKSSFYDTWAPPGKTSLFKEQDNNFHGQLRKRFANMYSMTSAYTYEGDPDVKKGVTECVDLLCRKLGKNTGKEIDVAWWITCFAFDSIGVVTYGKRFGFLDEGRDIGSLSVAVYGAFTYGSWMGMFPDLHGPFQLVSAIIAKLTNWQVTGKMYLDSFTAQTTSQRRKDRFEDPTIAAAQPDEPTSILDKFLNANEADPAYFTDAHIAMGLGANVTAGSDTTSSTLTWALYYLVKHPDAMKKVRDELAPLKESRGDAAISLRDAQNLPYLNAVIDETLRLFPQTGFGLPRTVPPGGAEICGHHFPAGSVVSMNAWAMHYDPAYFDEPEQFQPERWLNESQEEREKMNRCYFPFGLGSRTCIGKNIASLVMLKALPQLVEKFDYELAGELVRGEGLPTSNIFLVRATAFPAVVQSKA